MPVGPPPTHARTHAREAFPKQTQRDFTPSRTGIQVAGRGESGGKRKQKMERKEKKLKKYERQIGEKARGDI